MGICQELPSAVIAPLEEEERCQGGFIYFQEDDERDDDAQCHLLRRQQQVQEIRRDFISAKMPKQMTFGVPLQMSQEDNDIRQMTCYAALYFFLNKSK